MYYLLPMIQYKYWYDHPADFKINELCQAIGGYVIYLLHRRFTECSRILVRPLYKGGRNHDGLETGQCLV